MAGAGRCAVRDDHLDVWPQSARAECGRQSIVHAMARPAPAPDRVVLAHLQRRTLMSAEQGPHPSAGAESASEERGEAATMKQATAETSRSRAACPGTGRAEGVAHALRAPIDLGSQISRKWELTDEEPLAWLTYRTSKLFDEREKPVLDYAVGLCRVQPGVSHPGPSDFP